MTKGELVSEDTPDVSLRPGGHGLKGTKAFVAALMIRLLQNPLYLVVGTLCMMTFAALCGRYAAQAWERYQETAPQPEYQEIMSASEARQAREREAAEANDALDEATPILDEEAADDMGDDQDLV